MTYARREEIFSKDYISVDDIQELLGMSYGDAAKLIREIKRGLKFKGAQLRLDINGKLHVQDYLDYFQLSSSRYGGGINAVIAEEAALKSKGVTTQNG